MKKWVLLLVGLLSVIALAWTLAWRAQPPADEPELPNSAASVETTAEPVKPTSDMPLPVIRTRVALASHAECNELCSEYSAKWLEFPEHPELNRYFLKLAVLPDADSVTEALREQGRAFMREAEELGEAWQHSTEMKRLSGLPGVTVVELSIYSYTGGAHGMMTVMTANIDNSNGRVLTLDDVVKPGSMNAFWGLVRKAHSAWAKDTLWSDQTSWPFQTTRMFLLRPKALELQYDPYVIGPYAVGAPRLRIPYEQLRDVLEPRWLPEHVAADR